MIIIGSLIFGTGAQVGVPKVFTERDPNTRLRLLEQGLTAWRVAQPLYGVGPMVVAIAVGYLAATTPRASSRIVLAAASLALVIGALTWSWSLFLRSTRISDFAFGRLPGWPFRTYVLLTIGGLILLGVGLLIEGFPIWLGWLIIGASVSFLAAYLRFSDIPPFVFYVLLLIAGVAILISR